MIALSFIIYHLSFSHAVAQTFLDRLQKPVAGQGVVTVHQDSTIDRLVLDPTSTVAPTNTATTNRQQTNNNTTAANNGNATTTTPNNGNTTATTTNNGGTTTTTERTARTTRKGIYKVQAYAGGNSRDDRKRAQSVGNAIRSRYPQLNVTVHFYSPRWICNVGNFRTYEEAEAMLRNIKGMGYRQALIVRTKK